MTAEEAVGGAWHGLARLHGWNADRAPAVLEELVLAYRQPHRHYHTLDHVAELLHLLHEHGDGSSADVISVAIIFHDAVYNPARHDNEVASAALAAQRLTELWAETQLVEKIVGYILATQHTSAEPDAQDRDLCLFLDLDLAILAAPPERYRAYAGAIRREYAAVPDSLYRPGRRHVLESLLAQETIYLSPRLREVWEGPARANLVHEIAELSG